MYSSKTSPQTDWAVRAFGGACAVGILVLGTMQLDAWADAARPSAVAAVVSASSCDPSWATLRSAVGEDERRAPQSAARGFAAAGWWYLVGAIGLVTLAECYGYHRRRFDWRRTVRSARAWAFPGEANARRPATVVPSRLQLHTAGSVRLRKAA